MPKKGSKKYKKNEIDDFIEEELFIKDSVFKLDNFPSSNTGFKRRFKKDKISFIVE